LGGAELAAMPRVAISEAAAPATSAVEKMRLFIIMFLAPSTVGFSVKFLRRGQGGTVNCR
jgi:hypothetical protein